MADESKKKTLTPKEVGRTTGWILAVLLTIYCINHLQATGWKFGETTKTETSHPVVTLGNWTEFNFDPQHDHCTIEPLRDDLEWQIVINRDWNHPQFVVGKAKDLKLGKNISSIHVALVRKGDSSEPFVLKKWSD